MNDQHYFSPDPTVRAKPRSVPFTVAGQAVTIRTDAGVFSADRLDPGTAVLLRNLPDPPEQGDLLDLGCGWGPLTMEMATRAPRATVWAVDVNTRALELTGRNASDLGLSNMRCCLPHEVPETVQFAAVWSNPPIRIGKTALHDLLRTWLVRLAPDGQAHLVVQRNLGADSLQRWINDGMVPDDDSQHDVADENASELPAQSDLLRAERVASSKGYRVLRVTR